MLSEKKANCLMLGGGLIIFFVFAVIMVFMTIGHNKRKNYEELHDKYLEIKTKTDYGKTNCPLCSFPFTYNSSVYDDCIQIPDHSNFWCSTRENVTLDEDMIQCPRSKCKGCKYSSTSFAYSKKICEGPDLKFTTKSR